jgi:hypothetical protein
MSCGAAPSGQIVDGLIDMPVPLDAACNYTILESHREDRPKNTTLENGVVWVDRILSRTAPKSRYEPRTPGNPRSDLINEYEEWSRKVHADPLFNRLQQEEACPIAHQ